MTDSQVIASARRFASRRARAGRWILAVTMTGAALALGSLHTQVLCIVAVALAVAVGLLWWGAEPMRLRPSAKILLGVCAGLTVYTALQAVPMPASWLAVIAPKNADVWARCLSPLHEAGPAWVTVSVDPIATRVEVLRGVVYGLALIAGLGVAARRDGVTFLERAILAAGVIVAVAAVLHPAFGAQKVFGFYKPMEDPGAGHIAPLLNSNHLAGFLNIALMVAIASVASRSPVLPRVILGALIALLVAVQFWVASRGGVLALVLGASVAVVMTRSSGRELTGLKLSGLLATLALAAGLGLVFMAAHDSPFHELADTSASKLDYIRMAFVHMIPAYPIFGVGRGAFESAIPEFNTVLFGRMTHPENLVVQWLSEWGIPVSLVAFGAIAYALRSRVALARSQPAVGTWAAIVAVVAQNMVDFSSEVPAVMIAVSVCGAIVVAGKPAVVAGDKPQGAQVQLSQFIPAVAVVSALVAVMAVFSSIDHELVNDRIAAYAMVRSQDVSQAQSSLRASMLRHPGEPYFPYAGSLTAVRIPGDDVMPWFERTLERAPVYPPAHHLLARWLRLRSPSHARLEYRIAAQQNPSGAHTFAQEALALVSSTDDALELVPDGSGATVSLDILAEGLRARLPATSVELDRDLLARDRAAAGPARRAADDAVLDLAAREAAPWCASDRTACEADALERAKRVVALAPLRCDGYVLEARVRTLSGDANGGLDLLRAATDRVDDRLPCLKKLASAALEAGDEARTTDAIERLSRAGCSSDAECVENLVVAAQMEEARGNRSRALLLYERAGERSPQRDDLLLLVAERASGAGLHALALDSYRKLAERHPGDPRYAGAVEHEQRAAIVQIVPK